MLCVDLDLFKNVNDSFGHPMGDRLLRSVADRLRSHVLGNNLVARLGGDEFAIILTYDCFAERGERLCRAADQDLERLLRD